MRESSFAVVKRDVPIDWVLRRYGATFPHRGTSVSYSAWHAVNCPFHRDNLASASYNLQRNRFRCHACQVSGSVIDVVMHAEQFHEPKDAVEWLIRNYKR